ncbi:MAG: hypothetical protein HKN18_08945 [Silicimonas sp.]|nr:hypothetical protein [Silicimonas sp.]
MTWFQTILMGERAITLLLFALYLITAVRLCRYSSWVSEGTPNPFLPRVLKNALIDQGYRQRLAY